MLRPLSCCSALVPTLLFASAASAQESRAGLASQTESGNPTDSSWGFDLASNSEAFSTGREPDPFSQKPTRIDQRGDPWETLADVQSVATADGGGRVPRDARSTYG
jgi:hypothetical protein